MSPGHPESHPQQLAATAVRVEHLRWIWPGSLSAQKHVCCWDVGGFDTCADSGGPLRCVFVRDDCKECLLHNRFSEKSLAVFATLSLVCKGLGQGSVKCLILWSSFLHWEWRKPQ